MFVYFVDSSSGIRRSTAPYSGFIYYSSIVAVSSRNSDRVRFNRSMIFFSIFFGIEIALWTPLKSDKKEERKECVADKPRFLFKKNLWVSFESHNRFSKECRKNSEKNPFENFTKKTKHRTSRLILIKSPD